MLKSRLRDTTCGQTAQYPQVCINLTSETLPEDYLRTGAAAAAADHDRTSSAASTTGPTGAAAAAGTTAAPQPPQQVKFEFEVSSS